MLSRLRSKGSVVSRLWDNTPVSTDSGSSVALASWLFPSHCSQPHRLNKQSLSLSRIEESPPSQQSTRGRPPTDGNPDHGAATPSSRLAPGRGRPSHSQRKASGEETITSSSSPYPKLCFHQGDSRDGRESGPPRSELPSRVLELTYTYTFAVKVSDRYQHRV